MTEKDSNKLNLFLQPAYFSDIATAETDVAYEEHITSFDQLVKRFDQAVGEIQPSATAIRSRGLSIELMRIVAEAHGNPSLLIEPLTEYKKKIGSLEVLTLKAIEQMRIVKKYYVDLALSLKHGEDGENVISLTEKNKLMDRFQSLFIPTKESVRREFNQFHVNMKSYIQAAKQNTFPQFPFSPEFAELFADISPTEVLPSDNETMSENRVHQLFAGAMGVFTGLVSMVIPLTDRDVNRSVDTEALDLLNNEAHSTQTVKSEEQRVMEQMQEALQAFFQLKEINKILAHNQSILPAKEKQKIGVPGYDPRDEDQLIQPLPEAQSLQPADSLNPHQSVGTQVPAELPAQPEQQTNLDGGLPVVTMPLSVGDRDYLRNSFYEPGAAENNFAVRYSLTKNDDKLMMVQKVGVGANLSLDFFGQRLNPPNGDVFPQIFKLIETQQPWIMEQLNSEDEVEIVAMVNNETVQFQFETIDFQDPGQVVGSPFGSSPETTTIHEMETTSRRETIRTTEATPDAVAIFAELGITVQPGDTITLTVIDYPDGSQRVVRVLTESGVVFFSSPEDDQGEETPPTETPPTDVPTADQIPTPTATDTVKEVAQRPGFPFEAKPVTSNLEMVTTLPEQTKALIATEFHWANDEIEKGIGQGVGIYNVSVISTMGAVEHFGTMKANAETPEFLAHVRADMAVRAAQDAGIDLTYEEALRKVKSGESFGFTTTVKAVKANTLSAVAAGTGSMVDVEFNPDSVGGTKVVFLKLRAGFNWDGEKQWPDRISSFRGLSVTTQGLQTATLVLPDGSILVATYEQTDPNIVNSSLDQSVTAMNFVGSVEALFTQEGVNNDGMTGHFNYKDDKNDVDALVNIGRWAGIPNGDVNQYDANLAVPWVTFEKAETGNSSG